MKKTLLIICIFLVLQAMFGIISQKLLTFLSRACQLTAEQSASLSIWLLGLSLLLANALMIAVVHAIMRATKNAITAGGKNYFCPQAVLLVFITQMLLIFVVNGFTELLKIPDFIESTLPDMLRNPLCLITIVVVGPIAEEVCFRRGILSSLYANESTKRYALLISSIIFGLIHFNPAQIIGAFILGLFFGWIYLHTRSLLFPILCHIFNNGLSVMLGIFLGIDMKISDFFMNAPMFYFILFLSVLLMAGSFKLLKSKIGLASQKTK